ncbi:MAG: sensor histidine kinase [Ktedonobacteraceae bacterium]
MQIHDPTKQRGASKSDRLSPYLLWLIWVIWLPFAIPDIIKLFQSHPPLVRLIATLLAVALFFSVYLWATWRNVQRLVGASSPTEHTAVAQWLPIAVLLALSFVSMFLYKGIGTPFIFTSAYIGGRLPTMRAVQAIVIFTLLVAMLGALNNPDWSYLGSGIILIAGVGIVTILIVRSVMTGRELRAAREEITYLAVTAERLRIARDLHDLLGHNLSLIALKSELARRLVSVAPEQAAVEIGDVEQVARTTLQEVREAVSSYRQPTLANELHAAQEILAAAGIAYRYEGDRGNQDILPPVIEAVLSWTVREGVTNVIRHSRAHQCIIRVTRDIHEAHVEVVDDGAKTPSHSSSPSLETTPVSTIGNGLHGLTERVVALGGRCEAHTQADGGFRLAVSVPLA